MTENNEQTINTIQNLHIHFATPCYNGVVTQPCHNSYMQFALMAMKFGIKFSADTLVNESLIPRGRNNMVARFLANKEATHLMWIDADIGWTPEVVIRMALHDVPVVCGLYPMKGLPIRYAINTLPGGKRIGPLLEVATSGNGFMLIKREVIEKLIEAMPETKYRDSINYGAQFEPYMYALFDTMIDKHGHYLSEDWTFCARVRDKLGLAIWVDTEIKLDHMGAFNFEGNIGEIKKLADEWGKIDHNLDQLKAYDAVQDTDA